MSSLDKLLALTFVLGTVVVVCATFVTGRLEPAACFGVGVGIALFYRILLRNAS